ncbi:unnamed protein product, partial [Amoebophrya sp. A25]
ESTSTTTLCNLVGDASASSLLTASGTTGTTQELSDGMIIGVQQQLDAQKEGNDVVLHSSGQLALNIDGHNVESDAKERQVVQPPKQDSSL